MTIDELILKYHYLKHQLGHAPSSSEFFKRSGVSSRRLGKHFNNNAWSKLVELCGDTPYKFSSVKSDFELILAQYGELTRRLGRVPLIVDWDNEGLRPSVSGLEKSHKLKWSELSNKFYEFSKDNSDWADIINLF